MIIQIGKTEDYLKTCYRTELFGADKATYDRLINHLEWSTNSGSINTFQIISLAKLLDPSRPKSPKDTSIHTIATQKKDKKIKLGPKSKSWG